MFGLVNRKITVAEYLTQRDLPADWRYGSPFGRIAAEIYRSTYRREPQHAFRWINGRFRRVMAYSLPERHVLAQAWSQYRRTTEATRPAPQPVSSDAMRWTPSTHPVRNHP